MWTKIWQPFVKNCEFYQQCRTTYVVKRINKAPLPSSTRAPSLRRRHYVYQEVENNIPCPQTMRILLQKYVEDLGRPGEIVTVKENTGRFLLLSKAAVYTTAENISAAGVVKQEDTFSSRFAGSTVKLLSNFVLNISLNREEPWTLEPWHIRSAFRKAHVHVPDYAFTIPKETISGPDIELEGKEFYITVTINNKENIPVRCRIHHWSTKKEQRIPPVRDHWKFPAKTIFAEDNEIAATLPEMKAPVLIDDDGPPHLRKGVEKTKKMRKKSKH